MQQFGERLKKLRREKDITQDTLAEYLGISYQAVSKWENNAGFPDISLLPAIAGFFSVSSDYLLGIEQENREEKIEKALQEASKFTHTGEIEKSINIIAEALKKFPNEHRLLCDLIEYKLMRPSSKKEWIDDIEIKANLILRDCHIDKIRHQTIGNLAKAYLLIGETDKVQEVAELLPNFAYSKARLLSLAASPEEIANHKPELILKYANILLSDILAVANHHIYRGDATIAVDICKKALTIITSIGAEGYLLYIQVKFYIHLALAYSKLQDTDSMYASAETALSICITIEKALVHSETKYTSPLLCGLVFSKENLRFNDTQNSLERYYNILTNTKLLNAHANEDRYKSLLCHLKEEIALSNVHNNVGGEYDGKSKNKR